MSNDVVLVQHGVTGKGEGDDIYILSGSELDAYSTVVISDAQGINCIQLIDGLKIISSAVANNTVRMTLSNGSVVDILGASDMKYVVGGDAILGGGGVEKDFAGFVKDVLESTVPSSGQSPTSGGAVVIDASSIPSDGSTGEVALSLALTDADATGSADEIQGTDLDDSIQATGGALNSTATLDADDTLVDSNLDDNDTLTIAASSNIEEMASIISGIENIVVNLTSFSDLSVDLAGVVGFGTTVTVNNLQTAGATGVSIVNLPGNATLVAGSGMTGTVSVSLEGKNATLDTRGVATTQVTGVDSGGVTALLANGSSVSLSGTSSTTDVATLKGVGTVTVESAAVDQVERLVLAGDSGDVLFNLDSTDDLLTHVTFTGDHSVGLALTVEQLSGLAVVDEADSGVVTTLKLLTAGTGDLSALSVDSIDLATGGAAGSYTLANQQTVKLSADVASSGVTLDANLASGNETLNLQVETSQTGGKVTVSDFEVVNLSALSSVSIAELEGDGTNTTVNLAGSQNITLTKVTANGVNGTAMSGDLTLTLSDTLMSATGGSGGDTFIAWDGDMSIDGGGGTDILQLTGGLDLSDNILFLSNLDALQITDSDAVSVTINASELHGKTLALKGTDTADTYILNMDENVLDLSACSVDSDTASVSIVSTDVAVNALTITGSMGSDSISAGSQADTITGGEGADVIMGNGGNDTIILTETISAVDRVIFTGGSSDGVDTVTGFNVANDQIGLYATDLTADAAATSGSVLKVASEATSLVTSGAAFTLANSSADFSVIELTTTLDSSVSLGAGSTGTDLLQALSSDATAASGITLNGTGEKAFLVTYQNNQAFLWYLAEGSSGTGTGDTTVLAGDIALVGVFNSIAGGDITATAFVAA
ncbi:beta strand repeat-containing protein [Oceanospirillum beijerinckii]|uniref:beta strand repeat-containing protein n=1 Tax=Oceanospirillum beijerinckii TaxID=64976 RepID=UPI0003F6D043|nr:hypothetical protein [Oceanospirillum beijerinckii]